MIWDVKMAYITEQVGKVSPKASLEHEMVPQLTRRIGQDKRSRTATDTMLTSGTKGKGMGVLVFQGQIETHGRVCQTEGVRRVGCHVDGVSTER
jgi:hypothetical protein